ncbi:hypothetical protein ROTAS13_02606 [Roseomonas sp. TAS13]|nr:hypothetical protein ROTAS13_02606 [Roseomonas sp. TAS13]
MPLQCVGGLLQRFRRGLGLGGESVLPCPVS